MVSASFSFSFSFLLFVFLSLFLDFDFVHDVGVKHASSVDMESCGAGVDHAGLKLTHTMEWKRVEDQQPAGRNGGDSS